MKDEYDFTNAIANPYAEKIRKEGYTITVKYTPEYLAELRNNQEPTNLEPQREIRLLGKTATA